ncbi:ISBma1, transposase [Burkholderia pseudomallei]|nr:ISBma1, transposase [Burkholderia pseudomallei]
MLDRKALQALGCWTGYRLERVEWPQGDSRTLSLYLKPVSQIMYCEQCGARCQQIHETTVRRVRDLPLFEYRVVLHVPRRRVWCERCGAARLEKLDWLGRYQRVTERFAKACEKLLQAASVQAVAAFYELGWHTVKSIDKMRLRARVAEPDWSTIRYLAMDEFALHKGHRYATVVVDPIGRQVLWVGPGRSRETARAFFEQLPEGVAERIEAVAIDMTTAYELEIKEQCPQAEIVFDLYHVVAKYGREVIDRVRVDQANQLRHDKPARKVLKSSRWLLLRSAAGEAGLAGPLPAGDGAVCQGLREVAAGRQRTGRGGLLRTGLAHGQIDRQDALARARGRTGLVDDPLSGDGRVRAP